MSSEVPATVRVRSSYRMRTALNGGSVAETGRDRVGVCPNADFDREGA